MIILDPNRKIKKYALIGAVVLVVLSLALVLIPKKRSGTPANQAQIKKELNPSESQKALLDSISKKNESIPSSPQEIQGGKQQEVIDAINETNKDQAPLSQEEQNDKTQKILNAIDEVNKN